MESAKSPGKPQLKWQPSTVVSENRAGLMPEMAEKFKHILEDLGEDPNRPGLVDTPKRAAQALLFFTKGYEDRYVVITKADIAKLLYMASNCRVGTGYLLLPQMLSYKL